MSMSLTFSMFFLSFSPLWLTVLFVDFKSIFIDRNEYIITEVVLISTIVLLWFSSFINLIFYLHKTDNANTEDVTLNEAKEEKTITTDFFLSYVFPLFAFDFTQWDGMVEFLVFFLVLAFLCIRHNHFSVNIILEIMKYNMYSCVLQNADDQEVEKIILSKGSLSVKKGSLITIKHINNDYAQML